MGRLFEMCFFWAVDAESGGGQLGRSGGGRWTLWRRPSPEVPKRPHPGARATTPVCSSRQHTIAPTAVYWVGPRPGCGRRGGSRTSGHPARGAAVVDEMTAARRWRLMLPVVQAARPCQNDPMRDPSYRMPARVMCDVCQQDAVSTCPRCGRPLCLHHLPPDDRTRCTRCELEFLPSRRRWGRVGVALGLGLGGSATALAATVFVGPVLPFFAAAGATVGAGVAAVLRRHDRRRFLAERPGANAAGPSLDEVRIQISPHSQAPAVRGRPQRYPVRPREEGS